MWHLLPILTFWVFPLDSLKIQNGWRQQQIVVSQLGMIEVNDLWLITGTVRLTHDDEVLPEASWIRDDSTGYYFSYPTAIQGDTLVVTWRSASVNNRNNYFYFQPASLDTTRSPTITTHSIKSSDTKNPFDPWPGIKRSGTIVRGVKFGSANESGSTSGLHLEVSGRPSSGLEVAAVVDDRSLGGSTGGSSTTLAELDKLYITASTRHMKGTLGDWDVDWQGGEFGNLQRKLKGGKFNLFNDNAKVEVLAAGGNSRYANLTIFGRSGNQGPYELKNRYGNVGVSIIAGSERVSLDGRRLTRGVNFDYTIDYDRGNITFHPSIPILDNSRIDVEYEYSDDAYSKRLLASKGHLTSTSGTKMWMIEAGIVEERVDGNSPLAFEWTSESRKSIVDAGDNQQDATSSGVTFVEFGEGDYVWSFTMDGDSILHFSPPDSLARPTGNLRVDFSRSPGGGYSRVYDNDYLLFRYFWIGLGAGQYSPTRSIPLPDRTRLGVARGDWNGDRVYTSFEAAISDYDQNTLSSIDDNDNPGLGLNWRSGWVSSDSRLTTNVTIKHKQKSFRTLARQEPLDFRYRWGMSEDNLPGAETSFEAGANFMPVNSLSFSSDIGRLDRGSALLSNRIGLGATHLTKEYQSDFSVEQVVASRKVLFEEAISGRGSASVSKMKGILRPRLALRYESQTIEVKDSLTGGLRFTRADPGLTFDLQKLGKFDLGYIYRLDDVPVAGGFAKASDSRSAQVGWQGTSRIGQWRSTFLRSLQAFTDPTRRPLTSTSAAITALLGGRTTPVKFSGDYRLSTGTGRAEVRVATFVGEGEGSYRYEDGRYVPDDDGNIDLQSQQSDDTRFASNVEFNGRLEWRSKAKQGENQRKVYPFGISGTNTFFDAAVSTTEPDPLKAFLLYRPAFRSSFVDRSRWNWRQEIEFLDGAYRGDGRLTLRRDELHDAGISGGEESLTEALNLRVRYRTSTLVSLQVMPLIERQRRFGLTPYRLRADVSSSGGDIEATISSELRRWETNLKAGRETRHESVADVSVTETRFQPFVLRRFGDQGSGRLEFEWRLLEQSSTKANYDLLRGWYAGDNYSAGFSVDYRLGSNLTATASLRSRWRPSRAPLHSGLVEMTATL